MNRVTIRNDWFPRIPPTEKGTVYGREGQAIRYSLYGDSGPAMILCNGMWNGPEVWEPFVSHFQPTHRLLLWEYPGHGFSSATPTSRGADIRSFATDAASLLKGIGIRQAVLVGQGAGLPVVLELYRLLPEMALSIIGICGTERGPLARLAPFSSGALLARSVAGLTLPLGVPLWKLLRAFWRAYLPLVSEREPDVARGEMDAGVHEGNWRDLLLHTDPGTGLRFFSSMLFYKPSRFLPQTSVPVLILGGNRDRLVPVRRYRNMVRKIPSARLVLMNGCSHQALSEEPARVTRKVQSFLDEFGIGK